MSPRLCLAAALALLPALTSAETVTVEKPAALTLWSPKLRRPASLPPHTLHLRGDRGDDALNRVLLRFDLPDRLRGKTLAKATLEVFVPAVNNLRMICEILCREVTQPWTPDATWSRATGTKPWTTPGGSLDLTTDHQRGRPAGAVDSFAFWEYAGKYFPHRYRFLGCPPDGRWIDFNVTPLVRKWLADPAANRGLALHLVHLADRRFPNRAAIDVPGPAHPDAAHRPRLVLTLAPVDPPYRVGATHTLRKFCDFSTRYRYPGPFGNAPSLAMARNETEGFQLVVHPLHGPLRGLTFACTDLRHATDPKARIPKSDVAWHCQDVFPRLHRNGKIGDWYFHGHNFAVPDPLTPPRPRTVPEPHCTPVWFKLPPRAHPLPRPLRMGCTGTLRTSSTILTTWRPLRPPAPRSSR